MVLPSNSSMSYFPDNTTSCFATHLPHEIKLHGEWHVGLVEIYVPCSIGHFQDNDAFYTFSSYDLNDDEQGEKKYCHFPFGIYDSLQQMTDAINNSNHAYKHLMLEPGKKTNGYYAIRRKCDCIQTRDPFQRKNTSHFLLRWCGRLYPMVSIKTLSLSLSPSLSLSYVGWYSGDISY